MPLPAAITVAVLSRTMTPSRIDSFVIAAVKKKTVSAAITKPPAVAVCHSCLP